jgi:hypothetical protein
MKAPMALQRVGRSIGVIRTKVSATMRRSHTSRPGAALKKDFTEEIDERDDFVPEKRSQHRRLGTVPNRSDDESVDETDPAETDPAATDPAGTDPSDYLTMLRSGSTSMEDIGIDNFDRALTVIENERPEQIALPPYVSEAQKENLIQSPPHVQENPMTFSDDDFVSTLDTAAANMARTMSNLMLRTYSTLVKETNATVLDAVNFTQATEQPAQQEDEPTNDVDKSATIQEDAVEAAEASPVLDTEPADPKQDSVEPNDEGISEDKPKKKKSKKKTSKKKSKDTSKSSSTDATKEDSQEAQSEESAPTSTEATAVAEQAAISEEELKVEVEATAEASTTRSIESPKAIIANDTADEDVTVSTAGPEVVLPPSVQNKSDSISGRAPDRVPSRTAVIATAFANFGNRMCRYQGEDPGVLRMFDAVRDVLCCPDEQVAAPTAMQPTSRPVSPALSRSSVTAAKAQNEIESEEDATVQEEAQNEIESVVDASVQEEEGTDTATDDDDVSQCTDPDDDEVLIPVDSFDEIAQATILVSDMIKVQGSFTSEQCDQVERALKVLEQQAKKIGVNESDLLAAMASSEDNDSQDKMNVPSSIALSIA